MRKGIIIKNSILYIINTALAVWLVTDPTIITPLIVKILGWLWGVSSLVYIANIVKGYIQYKADAQATEILVNLAKLEEDSIDSKDAEIDKGDEDSE